MSAKRARAPARGPVLAQKPVRLSDRTNWIDRNCLYTHPMGKGYQLVFKVGVQSFTVGPVFDDREDAVWMGKMMAKALDALIGRFA